MGGGFYRGAHLPPPTFFRPNLPPPTIFTPDLPPPTFFSTPSPKPKKSDFYPRFHAFLRSSRDVFAKWPIWKGESLEKSRRVVQKVTENPQITPNLPKIYNFTKNNNI